MGGRPISNVVPFCQQFGFLGHFGEVQERFFGLNTEFFVPQKKIRSHDLEDAAANVHIALVKPKNGLIAKEKQELVRFEWILRVSGFGAILLQGVEVFLQGLALGGEFIIGEEAANA